MSPNFYIETFARFCSTLELLWLRSLRQDQNGNWTLTACVRNWETQERADLQVPLGLATVLVPGQVFHGGRLGTVPSMGQLGNCVTASLRQFERATLADVPSSVFSDGLPRNSKQELLLYRTEGLDLFIPPLEIVRRLFLLDRTLANVVLRKGGLAELCVPIKPDFYDEIELNFTAAIPPKALTKSFVRRFAWLAVHPTGARAWKSIERLSNTHGGVNIDPPEVRDCKISFRGLVGQGAALVHEILEVQGLRDPAREVRFSHPQIRQSQKSTRPRKACGQSDDQIEEVSSKIERVYEINNGASGKSSNPPTIDIQRFGADFTSEIKSIQRLYQVTEEGAQTGTETGQAGSPGEEDAQSTEVSYDTVKLSVSDIEAQPKLKPVSFRILEPPSPNYEGEFETLLNTLRRMQELIPCSMSIAATLCALPKEGPISWVGQYRRPCLVALFTCPTRTPTVLVDVDHGGKISLSALSLHFVHRATPLEIEHAIGTVLKSLVPGGRWPPDLEARFKQYFEVKRLKRMLREESREKDKDYQTRWAAMLVERLSLGS